MASTLIWKLDRVIKDEFVAALRVSFKHHPDFGTTDISIIEPEKSLLLIAVEYLQNIHKYPVIAISKVNVKSARSGIGDFAFINDTEIYSGRWDITVPVECAALTIFERDRLTDWVAQLFNSVLRKHFWELGINVWRVISSNTEQRPYGKGFIYVGRVSVECWTEWIDDRETGTIRDIEVSLQELRNFAQIQRYSTSLEALNDKKNPIYKIKTVEEENKKK